MYHAKLKDRKDKNAKLEPMVGAPKPRKKKSIRVEESKIFEKNSEHKKKDSKK